MAPGPGGTLFVSIPRSGGSVLALLDRSGRPRPGWPIAVTGSTRCGLLLPVDDGSVRVVCDAMDLSQPDYGQSEVLAFAFYADGRSLAGWPVQLGPTIRLADGARYAGRVVGDELTFFAEQQLPDTPNTDTDEAWVTSVAGNGSIRSGVRVQTACCPERWAVGPDGVAYGILFHLDDAGAEATSELVAVGPAGILAGFPVVIKGIASRPAFDAAGRIHVTVANVTVDSPRDGPAQTLVFDTEGRAVDASSDELGITASGDCVGIEGSCPGPAAPLVGPDGTTFVISSLPATTVVGLSPSGRVMAGWPYRSAAGGQTTGFSPAGASDPAFGLAAAALGPGTVLYLLHGAASSSVGGSIVAVGRNGQVRPGWPVELKRPGAAFWSVVVGSDGTAYALTVEPESGDASSATVIGIAPDSTVLWTTTIIDP